MLRRLLNWHFKRRRLKLARESLFSFKKSPKRWFMPKQQEFHFHGESFYSYEKPARRHFKRYFFLAFILLGLVTWFFIETSKGWNLFRG